MECKYNPRSEVECSGSRGNPRPRKNNRIPHCRTGSAGNPKPGRGAVSCRTHRCSARCKHRPRTTKIPQFSLSLSHPVYSYTTLSFLLELLTKSLLPPKTAMMKISPSFPPWDGRPCYQLLLN